MGKQKINSSPVGATQPGLSVTGSCAYLILSDSEGNEVTEEESKDPETVGWTLQTQGSTRYVLTRVGAACCCPLDGVPFADSIAAKSVLVQNNFT